MMQAPLSSETSLNPYYLFDAGTRQQSDPHIFPEFLLTTKKDVSWAKPAEFKFSHLEKVFVHIIPRHGG